jgi:hypothetical protein
LQRKGTLISKGNEAESLTIYRDLRLSRGPEKRSEGVPISTSCSDPVFNPLMDVRQHGFLFRFIQDFVIEAFVDFDLLVRRGDSIIQISRGLGGDELVIPAVKD